MNITPRVARITPLPLLVLNAKAITTGTPVYAGTVPADEVAARRRKNRAARKARRTTRLAA